MIDFFAWILLMLTLGKGIELGTSHYQALHLRFHYQLLEHHQFLHITFYHSVPTLHLPAAILLFGSDKS